MGDAFLAPQILSISELTGKLRSHLEANFPYVWIRGEVTNLGRPGSGHIYFNLKDWEAQIQCVWFKHNQPHNNFNSLTGEILDDACSSLAQSLANGVEIICGGKIGIYSAKGQYQLIIEFAEYAGEGNFALAFEKQKSKLAARGYFLSEHKKKVPHNPQKVILITSPHGAALHDFMELANLRAYNATIRLVPVSVQGNGAAEQIATAINRVNGEGWGEIIVIIRGGGSAEDLWVFNEEIVADAIFNSQIPIVAGIGHEIDVSIADLVADMRAATPSHAAELLWTAKSELAQVIDEAENKLWTAFNLYLDKKKYDLNYKNAELQNLSPQKKLLSEINLLENISAVLTREISHFIIKCEQNLCFCNEQIQASQFISSLPAALEKISNCYSSINFFVMRNINKYTAQLDFASNDLENVWHIFWDSLEAGLEHRKNLLNLLDPFLPLKKGYCLLFRDNEPVLSIRKLQKGDKMKILMNDGEIFVTIHKIIGN